MKMFSQLEYPEEITDYIGTELIVEDETAKDILVEWIRDKTRPMGIFERFKDTKNGKKPDQASSSAFEVTKFIMRIPVKSQYGDAIVRSWPIYERTPVEIQILTRQDAINREDITEATHFEYKRRQFMNIFPALFPQQIYEPLLDLTG